MPLESWLAGVIDALCKTDNSGKAETEKKYTVNFCCVIQCGWDSGVLRRLEKMRLFPDSWSHFYSKGFFSQHCIRVKSSMHQDTSACIKGACIRPSTHQHAGSSHSSCNVVSIGVSGGLQAGVWLQKGPLSGQPRREGATVRCAVWAESIGTGWVSKMEGRVCFPEQETSMAIARGAGPGGQGYQRLLILQLYLCRGTRKSRLRMTIRRHIPAGLQVRILKIFSEDD